MINRIKGRKSSATFKHLSVDNNIITDKRDIANALAKQLAYNSSSNHCSEQFVKHKRIEEKEKINFSSSRIMNFISKFLENRNFRVRLGSTLSDHFGQEMGVPQGSILSVTLFSLKINSLAKILSQNVQGSLYVDDF